MNESLLRGYVAEALNEILGVKRDEDFINFLRRGPHGMEDYTRRFDVLGKLGLRVGQGTGEVNKIVDEWIEDIEYERGMKINSYNRMVVARYVARKWPELLVRFNDDHYKARQTLVNILNTRFNYIRIER